MILIKVKGIYMIYFIHIRYQMKIMMTNLVQVVIYNVYYNLMFDIFVVVLLNIDED